MYSSHVWIRSRDCPPCIRRICPSVNTALGRKGAFFVNASRDSDLKLCSQVLSIVISLSRARRVQRAGRFRSVFFLITNQANGGHLYPGNAGNAGMRRATCAVLLAEGLAGFAERPRVGVCLLSA